MHLHVAPSPQVLLFVVVTGGDYSCFHSQYPSLKLTLTAQEPCVFLSRYLRIFCTTHFGSASSIPCLKPILPKSGAVYVWVRKLDAKQLLRKYLVEVQRRVNKARHPTDLVKNLYHFHLPYPTPLSFSRTTFSRKTTQVPRLELSVFK